MADHATTYSDKFVYHEPGLQHQFEDMKQQEESVSIGMWMFLVQEIMFFGGLFTVYLVFRSRFPMAFATGSNHLNVVMGFVNTLVLIVSSLTMALTVYYAQRNNRNMQVIMIILTMIFGATFLGVKYVEYREKYEDGLVPVAGWNRRAKAENSEHASAALPIETRVGAQQEHKTEGKQRLLAVELKTGKELDLSKERQIIVQLQEWPGRVRLLEAATLDRAIDDQLRQVEGHEIRDHRKHDDHQYPDLLLPGVFPDIAG